jgi:Protein of unknown function (DUF2934)
MSGKKQKSTRQPPASAPKRRRTPGNGAPAPSADLTAIGPQERYRMIAETAYFRAERRGFIGGSSEEDWFQAEAEVDSRLAGGP